MTRVEGYPSLIIGSNKLLVKRGDTFTTDRFISMLCRHFRSSSRVIVYSNFKTEEFASSIIEIFCDAFMIVKEEKSIVEVTKRDGQKIKSVMWILDKLPAIRRD